MAREWHVTFEGEEPGTADDFILTFTDMKEVVGNYLGLKEVVMKTLANLIKAHQNYSAIGNIKEIQPPPGEQVNIRGVWALLGIDKEGLRFGFLFVAMREGSILVGVWPKPYAEAVKQNERLLGGVINSMLRDPDNWRRVDVILPLE